jgi:hypothetical protein
MGDFLNGKKDRKPLFRPAAILLSALHNTVVFTEGFNVREEHVADWLSREKEVDLSSGLCW